MAKLSNECTYSYELDIETKYKDENRDLVITEKVIIEKEDSKLKCGKSRKTYYKFTCNICGWKEGLITKSHLKEGRGCGCCNGKIVVKGINDIPTTASWMTPYFLGGYEVASKYNRSSNKRVDMKCPECGCIKINHSINTLYSNSGIGCNCKDGVSYPEKFISSILNNLGVEFECQSGRNTFKWLGDERYRYDFYIPSKNTIIEVNGNQHYERCSWYDLEDIQESDENKKLIAELNGIDNYIVIDARNSNMEFIKKSIINSELLNMYDLSIIDWRMCDEYATKNIIRLVCEYADKNKSDIKELMRLFCMSEPTIRKYLKKGNSFGWCEYSKSDDYLSKNIKIAQESCKIKVEVLKDGESLGIFDSISEVEIKSEKMFGVKLLQGNISYTLNGHKESYKGFKFRKILE